MILLSLAEKHTMNLLFSLKLLFHKLRWCRIALTLLECYQSLEWFSVVFLCLLDVSLSVSVSLCPVWYSWNRLIPYKQRSWISANILTAFIVINYNQIVVLCTRFVVLCVRYNMRVNYKGIEPLIMSFVVGVVVVNFSHMQRSPIDYSNNLPLLLISPHYFCNLPDLLLQKMDLSTLRYD